MEKANLDWSNLPFGYMKTDFHLEYYYKNGKWSEAKVVEKDTIELSMAATSLHYGQEAFEGLKAYEHKDGSVSLFRPEENARRLQKSAEKLIMVAPPEELFLEAMEKIVQLNKRFVPPYGTGAALYIRPLLIGISGMLGVQPSNEYLFLVFASPVGPYFKEGLKPLKFKIEEKMKRAAPGGTGDVKVGGNYAASLRVSRAARAEGFKEVIYTDAETNQYLDESGPANFFAISKDGTAYITPKSETILPSITNKCLMYLAEHDLGLRVENRPVKVDEIFDFSEAGCCGTAAVITPIESLSFRDDTIVYAKDGKVGPVSQRLYDRLTGMQVGDVEDKFGWSRKVKLD